MTDMVAKDYHLEFLSPKRSSDSPQKSAELMALPANEPEEPRKKRVRPLSRVASLVSLISPVKSTSIKRLGQSLQRSISLRPESGPLVPPSPPSSPVCATRSDGGWRSLRLGGGGGLVVAAAPPSAHPVVSHGGSSLKRRDSKLWSEMYDTGTTERLSRAEIKRQEAIFELAQGEQDLIEDLTLAKKVYHDPMLTLAIMSAQELEQIFGMLETFIPLHAELLAKLKMARKDDGTTDRVGHILAAWLPCLTAYSRYCGNQVSARLLLERKRGEARVRDFLQRCLESPFSRRLDLWSFLDAPRSRLVKYPLLLRGILRHTPNGHADRQLLEEAISTAAGIVRDVNSRTGESECRYFWERLDWSEVPPADGTAATAPPPRLLSCHGELRTARGARVYVFLFERSLVVTRPLGGVGGGGGGGGGVRYRARGRPIPVGDLSLWDLTDGDVIAVGGSFRGAFRGGQRAMNMFRVGHADQARGQSVTLRANDTFGKQRWLACIRAAVQAAARQRAGTTAVNGTTAAGNSTKTGTATAAKTSANNVSTPTSATITTLTTLTTITTTVTTKIAATTAATPNTATTLTTTNTAPNTLTTTTTTTNTAATTTTTTTAAATTAISGSAADTEARCPAAPSSSDAGARVEPPPPPPPPPTEEPNSVARGHRDSTCSCPSPATGADVVAAPRPDVTDDAPAGDAAATGPPAGAGDTIGIVVYVVTAPPPPRKSETDNVTERAAPASEPPGGTTTTTTAAAVAATSPAGCDGPRGAAVLPADPPRTNGVSPARLHGGAGSPATVSRDGDPERKQLCAVVVEEQATKL